MRTDLKSFLKEQESESIAKLLEKIKKANAPVKDKKETAKELKKILNDYISDMTSLVNAKNPDYDISGSHMVPYNLDSRKRDAFSSSRFRESGCT